MQVHHDVEHQWQNCELQHLPADIGLYKGTLDTNVDVLQSIRGTWQVMPVTCGLQECAALQKPMVLEQDSQCTNWMWRAAYFWKLLGCMNAVFVAFSWLTFATIVPRTVRRANFKRRTHVQESDMATHGDNRAAGIVMGTLCIITLLAVLDTSVLGATRNVLPSQWFYFVGSCLGTLPPVIGLRKKLLRWTRCNTNGPLSCGA